MFESIKYSLKSLLKKPFKIGIISYYYPEKTNQNNGVAIHAQYLSKELAKIGCEIHVFTKGEKTSVKKEFIGEGKIVIHRIDTNIKSSISDVITKIRMSHFMFDNKIINEVSKENQHEKFDIIHTHGWLTAGAFISKYFNDLKWIHTFHAVEKNRLKFMSNDNKKYFKIAKWVESTITHADALIAVSNKLKLEVLQNYPVKKEKIHFIPNGVDNVLFCPNKTPEEKNILYIGRFSHEKGIDIVLKIAEKVLQLNQKTKFTVVASDEKISQSMEKTRKGFELLLEKYPKRFIWYREKLSRKELSKLYQEAIIYIQPSRYEACPLCVLEAMACGKAIICSNKGGMPELVENAGMVIPLNSNLFAKKILKLLMDYKLRERYSRRALERSKLFNWEDIAKKTLILYKKISGKLKKGEDKNDEPETKTPNINFNACF